MGWYQKGKVTCSAASIFKTRFSCCLERRILERAGKLVRRTSFAPTLEKVLAATEDIKLCVFLPVKFLHYASSLLRQALIARGIITENEEGPKILYDAMEGYAVADKKQHDEGWDKDYEGTTPVCWRINAITAWQQIDRRIDECVLEHFYTSCH